MTVTFKQEENNRIRAEAKWTPPGSPDDIPIPGFSVDRLGNYVMTNDSDFEIQVSGLKVERKRRLRVSRPRTNS